MYYNEKRKAITAKYVKTHLDDIKIRVPKGEREKLKAVAAEMGMSMNQMFIKAVEEYIEKNYKPEAENRLTNRNCAPRRRAGSLTGEKPVRKGLTNHR